MASRFLLVLVFYGVCGVALAQRIPSDSLVQDKPVYFEQPKPLWKQKLHYGGNIWLGFWGAFYVDASPMVGYEITETGKTIAGIGSSFIYQGVFNQGGTFVAGPRFFIRQAIWRSIFAHAEYELMNAPRNLFYSWDNQTPLKIGRKWEGSPLIGGGFYQGRNRKQGGSFISLMYNMGYLYNKGFISPQGLGGNNSPFIIRFGFFI